MFNQLIFVLNRGTADFLLGILYLLSSAAACACSETNFVLDYMALYRYCGIGIWHCCTFSQRDIDAHALCDIVPAQLVAFLTLNVYRRDFVVVLFRLIKFYSAWRMEKTRALTTTTSTKMMMASRSNFIYERIRIYVYNIYKLSYHFPFNPQYRQFNEPRTQCYVNSSHRHMNIPDSTGWHICMCSHRKDWHTN